MGGIGLPLTAGQNWVFGTLGGAAASGANTGFNNWMYDENTSIGVASLIGGVFGVAGSGASSWMANRITFTTTIPISGSIPRIPAQPPRGAPYATQIGNAAGNTVGGIPSFIPLSPNTPTKAGEQK